MQPSPLALTGETSLALPPARPLTLGVGGMALFGFALRTAVSHEGLGAAHFGWALALPGTALLTWALCLPALYILWASHQESLTMARCGQAALEALETSGKCLASTAPILWFFAATAPESSVVAPLALLFTGLALVGGGAVFGEALRRHGAPFSGFTKLAFLGLFAITFMQCARGLGLRWS